MKEFWAILTGTQIWFILGLASFLLFSVLFFLIKIIYDRGLPKFSGEGYFIPPKNDSKTSTSPSAKQKIWFRSIKESSGKTIGEIGFLKETVVFKVWGQFWNSATNEGREGYDIFVEEFHPPEFLTEEQKKEAEAYLFVKDCNLQSKFISIIKKQSINWKHVFIICSKQQYSNGELDLLDNKLGGINLNITLIPISTNI